MKHLLRRLLTPPLLVLAALVMFVEEWLWDHLKVLMAAIGRLPLVRGLEARIARLGPYGAMVAFLAPGALLLPVKLSALWLIAHGHGLLGVGVIVAAKLAGTALVARIYALCKPALMTLGWFSRMDAWISGWRDRLYAAVRAMAFWHALQRAKARVRWFLRRFRGKLVKRRWLAIQRLRRRRLANGRPAG